MKKEKNLNDASVNNTILSGILVFSGLAVIFLFIL
jgi:hypothetical protein